MVKLERPFYPIIYVRGYAMTEAEITATVATPYMGFNLGSTKLRQTWEGKPIRHVFESPLIRLMKDYKYRDYYAEGGEIKGDIPTRSVIILRYYDQADKDFGRDKTPSIREAAEGLKKLIYSVRKQVCGDDIQAQEDFRVHLVAHSMGGLVCRCFLQNDNISTDEDRALVDKVFTYASPHNGIEMLGMNVPRFLNLWDMDNFNRKEMAGYLGLPKSSKRVDTLNGRFDPQRFFCLVGTNHKDYDVAGGLSARFAGEMSDGLVKIENATVSGAPRAFVHRSHSGPYGIVNSEEGYQNLTRFLFGDVKVQCTLEAEELPLPPSVERAHERENKDIRSSYYFEATVSPRGAITYTLSERTKDTYSAILRKFDDMFRLEKANRSAPRWPVLFSVFLDTGKITHGSTVVFSVDLAVSTTGYEIDEKFRLNRHIPGEYLFRDTVIVRARYQENAWSLRYNLGDDMWGEGRGRQLESDANGPYIPLRSGKGFRGRLRLHIDRWS